MVNDPYKVLGVDRNASKEEIKKAYRQKAKQYHPDLNPDDTVAAAKMNEVNEAYDMLNNPEKYRQQSGGFGGAYGNGSYGGSSGYGSGPYGNGGYGYGGYGRGYYNQGSGQSQGGSYGGFGYYGFDDLFGFGRYQRAANIPRPAAEPGDSDSIRQAIDFINMGQYSYAAQILNSMVSAQRNHRWYYLSGIVNFAMGQSALAMEQLNKAIELAPGKTIYTQTLDAIKQSGTAYRQAGQSYQTYNGMNSMCTKLCWLQCFCMFCCRC